MTMSEIACVCLDVERDKSDENATPDEIVAYIEWWQSLTPEQRLWAESDA